ncbi:MAG: SH3 domain-containing protein [Lachnospiraceae bacterium]|nr:SH3 domain-containing protein [Lachnospiraceae bacterium]
MKRSGYLLWGIVAAGWMLCRTECMAFTPVDATVKEKGINIRSEASTDGAVVSSAAAGSTIRVSDTVTGKDGKTWYVVYISGSKKGYIRGDLVTIGDSQTTAETDSASSAKAVQQDSAKTQDAQQDSKKIQDTQQDSAGTQDAQQESSKTQDTQQNGKKTQNAQQENAQGITRSGKGKVKGTGVRIRSLNSTNSAIVAVAAQNAEVTLLQKTTGSDAKIWYQVSLEQDGKNVVGYIRSDLVKIVKDVTTAAVSSPAQTSAGGIGNGAVRGVNVNVRMQPVNGTSICKLSTGHSVNVTKEVTGDDKKKWYYIQFTYGGVAQEGYIRSDFVVVEESALQNASREPEEGAALSALPAKIKGVNVRIRQSAVGGTVICQQSNGFALTVEGEVSGSDGKTWYQVSFLHQEKQRQGFVRSDFVEFSADTEIGTDDAYAAQLMELGFPKSYLAGLCALHKKHPKWTFQPVLTGLGWDAAVTAESKVGKNFVPKNSIASYKSLESTAYSYKNNKWYTFDGGSWVAASREVTAYYMDPRNFLDESGIYQFETLEYRDYQTKEGVAAMLASTFMKGNFVEPDGTTIPYASAFVDIGKQTGVNPYHLAARCYQEQGNGKSDSISGNVEGFLNIFNYFHIGAYAVNGNTPVRQGLIYASKTDSKYQRPWNTRYKSLAGGAAYLADKFISKKQNTLYFQKFNVVNKTNGIYSHQYMTNLLAASSEAARMKKAYGSEEREMEFVIPVYTDMPAAACEKPVSDLNPNNYLASLTVGKRELTPAFDGAVTEYSLTVSSKVSEVTIAAKPVAKTSTVSQLGKVSLEKGVNTFTVVCRSASGNSRTYTLTITRK